MNLAELCSKLYVYVYMFKKINAMQIEKKKKRKKKKTKIYHEQQIYLALHYLFIYNCNLTFIISKLVS
jgi:hypothetical protein